jgi:hypothetical protein
MTKERKHICKQYSGKVFIPESQSGGCFAVFVFSRRTLRVLSAVLAAAAFAAAARPAASDVSFPMREEGPLRFVPAQVRLRPAIFAVKGGQGALDGSIDFIQDVAAPFSLMVEETAAQTGSVLRERLAALDFTREELHFSLGAHLMPIEEQAVRLEARLKNKRSAE